MAEFEVETKCIQTMEENVNAQIKMLSQKVLELHQAMNKLHAEWEGKGALAFASEVEEDMEALKRLVSNLKTVCQYEKDAQIEYTSCEKKVANYMDEL